MFVCGSHLLPSSRTCKNFVPKRFGLPAKGSLGHNLVTLVKFQDPQNVLATHEQENCAAVSSTPFCDLPIMYQMLTELFTWRFSFKDINILVTCEQRKHDSIINRCNINRYFNQMFY